MASPSITPTKTVKEDATRRKRCLPGVEGNPRRGLYLSSDDTGADPPLEVEATVTTSHKMNPWDPVPYSVTPAAKVMARCVASGVMSQEDLDAVPREPNVFSSHLLEAVQLAAVQREIDQRTLQLDLLRLEKGSADVTHNHHLSQRFAALQTFTSHLQEVLREQTSLRQRLMKPLCQKSLPVEADLHRYVVELTGMVVDFIEHLEVKVKTVRSIPTTEESLNNLNNATAQLLAQVTEVEKLSRQVLRWRDQHRSMITDGSN